MANVLYLLGILCYLQSPPITFGLYTWHSTTYDFEKMIKTDLDMLKDLDLYLEQEKSNWLNKKKRLDETRTAVEALFYDVDMQLSDSLLNFDLIPVFENDTTSDNLKNKLAVFPSSSDRKAVLESFLQIQKIYKLKAKDLSRGLITKQIYGHKISADDCGDIGDMACEENMISICLDWYNETLNLILEGSPCRYNEEIVRDEINRVRDVLKCERLCNDNNVIVEIFDRRLKCQMWDNLRDPWLLLQPVKMEYLAKVPNIVRFYDVISNEEIIALKSLTREKFESAKISSEQNNVTRNVKSHRIAHNCWLYDSVKLVKTITHRIGHLTGHDMSRAEPLQMATYGIGGHYLPHFDWKKKNITEEYYFKNRKATFMFYLSDVEFGGSTVFLHPGISVRPIKGSAVFWYNLHNSGTVDKRTRHCACSVVSGSKWVANKWIRETNNEMCKKEEYIGRIK